MNKAIRNLAVIAASVLGLSALRKKARQQQAEQDLWTQATDNVTPAPAPAPSSPADTTPQS